MGLRALIILSLATILSGQELPPGVYRVGNGVAPPKLGSRVEPQYTETARLAGLEGTVVLKAIISDSGHPENIQVVRRLGLGLDQAAVNAVTLWQFQPGTKDGLPVPVFAQIEVTFRLLDRLESMEKLKQEANDGIARSQLRVGTHTGSQGPDGPKAVEWFRRAADQGEGAAQELLGMAYWNGLGVTRDLVQAYYWLTLAAQSGTDGASDDLAALTKTLSPEQLTRAQELVRSGRKP